MKSLSAFALPLILTLSNSSAFAAQGVYGTWKFPQFVSGPLVINSTLTVSQGSTTVHSDCSMGGQSASAEATAPAAITASQITILGAAQKDTNENGLDCHASIDQGSMAYSVSSDDSNLTLTAPGQSSVTLPRQ